MAAPPYSDGREHLSVIVSKQIKDALRLMAAGERLTLSQFCSRILEDYVESHEPEAAGVS